MSQAELTSLRRIQHASATTAEVDSASELNRELSSSSERVQKLTPRNVDAPSDSGGPATDFDRLAREFTRLAPNLAADMSFQLVAYYRCTHH